MLIPRNEKEATVDRKLAEEGHLKVVDQSSKDNIGPCYSVSSAQPQHQHHPGACYECSI